MAELDDKQVRTTSETILDLVLSTSGSSIDDKARKRLLNSINRLIKSIRIVDLDKKQENRYRSRTIIWPDGSRGSTGKAFSHSHEFPKIRVEKLFKTLSKRHKSGKSSLGEESFPAPPSDVCGE